MSRRLAALAALALMLLPAVLVASPAALAQDSVPFAPDVPYATQPNFIHQMYLRFGDAPTGTNCDSMRLEWSPASESSTSRRTPCALGVGTGGASTPAGDPAPATRTFETGRLLRAFDVVGNDSLLFVHRGGIPAGVTLFADVRSGDNLIGTATLRDGPGSGDDNVQSAFVVFDRLASSATFAANLTLRVVLRAQAPTSSDGAPTPPSTVLTYDLGTYLEIRSSNSVRAATWVGEPSGPQPKTLFRPVSNTTPAAAAPRMQFHFSIQSAFPGEASMGAPRWTLTRDGREMPLNPAGGTQLSGAGNATLGDSLTGTVTWTLPNGGTLDYRGFPPGEYTLSTFAANRQGRGIHQGVTAKVLLSDQGVRLAPYAEPQGASAIPAETTGHDVAAGGSTTYLLAITNTGSANDTFRVDASFVAGTPSTGWSVDVGGPRVANRRVGLAPGQSEIVTVAVTAPAGAAAGASSIFRVNATSLADPTAVSPTVTLTTTVTAALRREVAILVPVRTGNLTPGVDTEVPVLVWNRGTRAADVAIDLQETPVAGWSVDLLVGGATLDRTLVSNVPAGGVTEVLLRVQGPVNELTRTHSVVLNATVQGVTGVSSDRTLTFTLRTVGGLSVQILDGIAGLGHVAEIAGIPVVADPAGAGQVGCQADPNEPPSPSNCIRDNASGAWFRVWVTNTGKVTEDVAVSLDSIAFSQTNSCTDAVFEPHAPGSADFRVYARSASGRTREVDVIRALAPGDTAEVYVWRKIDGDTMLCTSSNFLSFVFVARGQATGSVGTAAGRIGAEDSGGREAVLLEGVARRDTGPSTEIRPALVDLTNATRRSVQGSVEANKTISYRVRVTHAASWGYHEDADGDVQIPRLHVVTEGDQAFADGWNVSVRPILDAIDVQVQPARNYSFLNEFNGRIEAWRDLELEVNVTAPDPTKGKGFAGSQGIFTLRATMEGRSVANTLQLATTVAAVANVTAAFDAPALSAHPGEPAPALLLVQNVGAIEANVTLRASIDPSTSNAAQWRVEPAFQNFRLSAAKNRTLAFLVTPPAGIGVGTTTQVNVLLDYSPGGAANTTLRLPVTVQAPGTLEVASAQTDVTIAPGGYANFTLLLRNRGNLPVPFRVSASPLPEWDSSVSVPEGTLQGLETRSVAYVVRAPAGVEDRARFASVVRVEEIGNSANFDAQTLGINILGGKAAPSVSAPQLVKRVDRGGLQVFPLEVRNSGNAAGRIPVEVRSSDPAWTVGVTDGSGAQVSEVRLRPNELAALNVTVRAPAVAPERSAILIDATASAEDYSQASKITLRAEIHDYGVEIDLAPSRIETAPGVPAEFLVKVRNTGNDNDTLNVSAHLVDLPDWSVSLSNERVPLEAGQESEIRAVLRPPANPLPTPRTYSFKFFAGTVGGAAVNVSKNDSVTATVVVPPYRAMDVDDDDRLEIAVDANQRASDGYEVFREIFNDGVQTSVVAVSKMDGKARFFLDVPRDRPLDGVADAWFDPESVYLYDIEHAPDLNKDGTPEYLLDVDNDGRIDRAYDTAGDTYWNADEVEALGAGVKQYVVDTSLDGKPDYYYDPAANLVTRTLVVTGQGANVVGLDTDGDGRTDKHYNYRTKVLTDAKVAKAGGFFTKHWYFFALFGLMALVTIALLVARRRRRET